MDITNKNYYELLGLEREASPEEIKQAFKEIALVYHPDSNFFDEIIEDSGLGDSALAPEDMKVFKAITQAYNTLSNAEKKKAYDAELNKKDISLGRTTGEWQRPDGSTTVSERKVREKAPTVTNLQKLQKQYEESVKARSSGQNEKVSSLADMKRDKESQSKSVNKLLIFALIGILILLIILLIIIF